mmetsp:Transcript_5486/g.14330  ORF Transcript_5486/g.14330 Transcript_5486/m.14330 type:complete len:253 (+) Transcript_5486:2192-2950(+)
MRRGVDQRHQRQLALQGAGQVPRRQGEPGAVGEGPERGESVQEGHRRSGHLVGAAGNQGTGEGFRRCQSFHGRRSASDSHGAAREACAPNQQLRLLEEQEPPESAHSDVDEERQEARHGIHPAPGQLRWGRRRPACDRCGPLRRSLRDLPALREVRRSHGRAPRAPEGLCARGGVRRQGGPTGRLDQTRRGPADERRHLRGYSEPRSGQEPGSVQARHLRRTAACDQGGVPNRRQVPQVCEEQDKGYQGHRL